MRDVNPRPSGPIVVYLVDPPEPGGERLIETSLAALHEASRAASLIGSLLVVCVVPPEGEPARPGPQLVRLARERREMTRETARRLRAIVGRELPGVPVWIEVVIGDFAREAARVARETEARLLVVPHDAHARRGVARLLAPSRVSRIVEEPPCPVLAVAPPRRESLPRRYGLKAAIAPRSARGGTGRAAPADAA